MRVAEAGDVILLIGHNSRKQFIRTLTPGETLHTHSGYMLHDELIGQPYGTRVTTHLGSVYSLLRPTTEELVRYLKRRSQIIFPKDAGYIIMKLGIRPGSQVVEAGTGSGGLAVALATAVGPSGHVTSYDVREDMQALAAENLGHVGLADRVTLRLRDVSTGFEETDADAVFLDLQRPWELLPQARAALMGGGMFGSLVPTVNQLVRLLAELEAHAGFSFVEAEELLLRPYKVLPQRVRPEDRVVGHTGYLVFARAIIPPGAADSPPPAAGDGESEADAPD